MGENPFSECIMKNRQVAVLIFNLIIVAVIPVFADDELFSAASITPKGQYYEADIPDTLDLAERAKLAVIGLCDFLNPKQNYAPFGQAYFNTQNAYMTQINGSPGQPNWGKITEAIIVTRLMSGSKERLDIQQKMMEGMINHIQPDGTTPAARVMMSLMSLYQQNNDPSVRSLIDKYAQSFISKANIENDYAFYYKDLNKPEDSKLGIIGQGWQPFIHGTAVRNVSRWSYISKDKSYADFCGKLVNWTLKPEFWVPEAEPKAVAGCDHGHFSGHLHSYTAGLMGMLWYADLTNDAYLKRFVRESYEYIRTFGIASVGLFGESCAIGDMTFIAAKLSDMGVGDYWEDVDRYTRNQLAEMQIADVNKLESAVKSGYVYAKRNEKLYGDEQKLLKDVDKDTDIVDVEETDENVCQRNLGCFLSDAGYPTYIPKLRFLWTICCTGNTTLGMFCAWDSIVRFNNETAQVNLLLNRASPWLDIDSYLPYEGKVVIKNKTAKSISVRVPLWVDIKDVKAAINGSKSDFNWVGRYIVINNLKASDVITVTFPMKQWTETYTLKWKKTDFWMECTDPGSKWTACENPDKFTFTFKGNTVIDVQPRYDGKDYRLYDRDKMKSQKVEFKKVERFVTPVKINW